MTKNMAKQLEVPGAERVQDDELRAAGVALLEIRDGRLRWTQ